jgi:hypothetical protein
VTWFYVDDGFSDHPKVKRIPRSRRSAALGLWVLAGSWCARHLTDGWVPAFMVDELGSGEECAEALVAARLWERAKRDDEDGFIFVDWATWQLKTREIVERERAASKERQARFRGKRKGETAGQRDLFEGEGDAVGNGVTNGVGDSVGDAVSDASPSPPLPPHTEVPSELPVRPGADAPEGADGDGSDALPGMPPPGPQPDNRTPTQRLIGDWIDHGYPQGNPPTRTKGHLGREVSVLLNRDHVPYDHLREALFVWHDRGLSPSQLANVVHELHVASSPPISPNGGAPTRRANGTPAGQKTADRVAALDALRTTPRTGTTPREITR